MKNVLKSVLLLTSLSTFAQDFGPAPWQGLYEKTKCSDIHNSKTCKIVSSADIAEEINVFDRYLQIRYETVLKRIASLELFADQIREKAGDDESLESFKFYQEAADQIEKLAQIDESISWAIEAFDPENSSIKKEMQKLYESALNFEQAIKQEENEEIKESIRVGMRTRMRDTVREKAHKSIYGHFDYRYFENDTNIVRAVLSNSDVKNFKIKKYVNVKGECANQSITLEHIAISKQIQLNGSKHPSTEDNFLTLIDDEKVIKGIIDGKKLTIKCKRIKNFLFNEPGVNFDEETNVLEVEWMNAGSSFGGYYTISATKDVQDYLRSIYNK